MQAQLSATALLLRRQVWAWQVHGVGVHALRAAMAGVLDVLPVARALDPGNSRYVEASASLGR